jgi:hypothetical protein
MSTPTIPLIRGLLDDSLELVSIEASLARAELRESASAVSSGLALIAAGAGLLFCAAIVLSIGVAYLLLRTGLAIDYAFLIVAACAMAIGGAFLLAGKRALSPSRLMPKKTLAQLSALFGGR